MLSAIVLFKTRTFHKDTHRKHCPLKFSHFDHHDNATSDNVRSFSLFADTALDANATQKLWYCFEKMTIIQVTSRGTSYFYCTIDSFFRFTILTLEERKQQPKLSVYKMIMQDVWDWRLEWARSEACIPLVLLVSKQAESKIYCILEEDLHNLYWYQSIYHHLITSKHQYYDWEWGN